MPKNKGKGGRKHRRGRKQAESAKRELQFKEDMQEYGQVRKRLGGNHMQVQCFDGKERRCRVAGHMRKRVWIAEGDIILVSLRDYEDDVGDIIHKYFRGEASTLKAYGEIPETVDLSAMGQRFEDGDDDDFRLEFDYHGYDAQDWKHSSDARYLGASDSEDEASVI